MRKFRWVIPACILFGLPWVQSFAKWNVLASGVVRSESAADGWVVGLSLVAGVTTFYILMIEWDSNL